MTVELSCLIHLFASKAFSPPLRALLIWIFDFSLRLPFAVINALPTFKRADMGSVMATPFRSRTGVEIIIFFIHVLLLFFHAFLHFEFMYTGRRKGSITHILSFSFSLFRFFRAHLLLSIPPPAGNKKSAGKIEILKYLPLQCVRWDGMRRWKRCAKHRNRIYNNWDDTSEPSRTMVMTRREAADRTRFQLSRTPCFAWSFLGE